MPFILTSKQKEGMELLSTDAIYFLFYGGSRSGKTALIIYIQLLLCLTYPNSRHLIARLHLSDLKSSIIHDTLPKIARLMSYKFENLINERMNKSDFYIKFPNGSSIWFGGLSDKDKSDKILGNEYLTIFLNEISQISYDTAETAMSRCAQNIKGFKNKIFCDCNPTTIAHWGYKLFFKNEDPTNRLKKKKSNNYKYLLMNPSHNPHLPSIYNELLENMSQRKRKRFERGEWQKDIEGALWSMEEIDRNYITMPKETIYQRIVIAVDPSVTNNPTSDEVGIIVVGLLAKKAYVLEDGSGKYSALDWARKVVSLYHGWQADKIICEVNQGGDLVERNIMMEDNTVPIKKVRAFKGKWLRAEPVQACYCRDEVKHVKEFNELENEMISFVNSGLTKSPNRVDALVYGVVEILTLNKKPFLAQL